MTQIHNVGEKFTNSYLLPCGEDYCLVDTGYKGHFDKFCEKLKEANVPMEKIKYVVLTHAHSFHAGYLKKLLSVTSATLIYDVRDKLRLEAGKNNLSTYVSGFFFLIIGKIAASSLLVDATQCFPAVRYDRYEDAKTQPLAEFGIEFLSLSGHTEYDVCVKYEDKLFCGDLCASGLLSARHAPMWIYNKYDLLRSWQALLDTDATTIYPGCGKPFEKAKLADDMRYWRSRGVFKL